MECTRKHVFFLLYSILHCSILTSADQSEAKALLQFRDSLSNNTALSNWNAAISLCSGNDSNWKGLLCSNGVIYGLRLEDMGLNGTIDVGPLSKLPDLRTLSLMNNSFGGPMPDFKKLGKSFRGLFLSNNSFFGEIKDDAFAGMKSMRKVFMENNNFNGRIPRSLGRLPKLVDCLLSNNEFEGEIPDFVSKDLRTVKFANNRLTGRIPASLGKVTTPASFSGNPGLCGKPLDPCKFPKRKPLHKTAILAAIIAAIVALAFVSLFCFLRRSNQNTQTRSLKHKKIKDVADHKQHREEARLMPKRQNSNKKGENGRLYFLRSTGEEFDLQELLKASAEVLGSGSFGSSYKAELLTGPSVVVKRFRYMNNVGREEFYEHMRRLGRLSHPNLLPIVAFYYKKDEKLLITDYVENGSLASQLHGKHNPNQPALDWPTRLNIVKGIARGLGYLYKELPTMTLPHGHLKSSNVLLDGTFEPLLTDYALKPVINREHAEQFMVACKSPEFTEHDKTTKKTDVWSLGILILELLTGKFPANYLKQGKGTNSDLAAWVESVLTEEWTCEVFDKDMKATKNVEGEMLKLLKIGMCCCEWDIEKRWEMWEALQEIEELKEKESDSDNRSFGSNSNAYWSGEMREFREFSFK